MSKETDNPESIFTLPVVVGVIIVLGGIGALVVSGLFVHRAHTVNAETHRLQASLEADREQEQQAASVDPPSEAPSDSLDAASDSLDAASEPPMLLTSLDGATATGAADAEDSDAAGITVSTLKPGVRLHAQRPAHWDQVEIIDILEDHKIKVRWLSGEPGEDVIAADLVRSDAP